MTQLSSAIAAEVVAACRANATEASASLGRALECKLALAAGEPTAYNADESPKGFDGPGLVVLLKFGEVGFVAVLPESSGALPSWYSAPDATGASKLRAMAQELSTLFVPESLAADEVAAAHVANIRAALSRAGVAADAALAPLELGSDKYAGQLSLIWPLAAPTALFDAASSGASTTQSNQSKTAATGSNSSAARQGARPTDFSQLPGYSRSLLKVAVPVSVRLATKKETIQEVVEIVPGSIIKFEKGCDELLQMVIGEQQIADGEAVKIGDKFGFRVTAMLLPSEHFIPLKGRRGA